MAGLPGHCGAGRASTARAAARLQLIGKPFEEETLFQDGHVIEQAAGRFTPSKLVVTA